MTETVEHIEINPADYAMRLTTTLNRLRDAGACRERYAHLVRALGGTAFDHDAPINLLAILEHNGTEDCLWALCATAENCDTVARLMAADFAEAVLPIFERERPNDRRPRVAIETARRFARAEVECEELAAARTAAWAAAGAAARAAAWAAARAAARAAAGDAARTAARAAAGDAARTAAGAAAGDAAWAAARDAQAEIIRRYLLP
jgi:hypothetical protein